MDRIKTAADTLRGSGMDVTLSMIDLAPIAVDIAQSIVSGFPTTRVQEAIERLAAADAVIASTPVYKAGISGLFKSFADLIDNDLLIAMPVILAATGGSARHAMVVDEQMRPLFAFLRAIPVPTSLYAAPEDWGATDLGKRVARAAIELASSCEAGPPAPSPPTTGTATNIGSPATRRRRAATSTAWTSAATSCGWLRAVRPEVGQIRLAG